MLGSLNPISEPQRVTQLLRRAQAGDAEAASALMPLVYRELHALAERKMRFERPNHTLQPTVLVNEAYLQLLKLDNVDCQNRAHFFALASNIMRRVLVDHARSANAAKRPGAHQQVTLTSQVRVAAQPIDILALNNALEELAAFDKRQAQVVEMRFFAGLSFEEIAESLDISVRTAKRDWSIARAWLHGELVPRRNAPYGC
ncbi:sigma-70 family RNA polymerase sigma factor [Terriglobus sp. TAA 43]|uniref:sigma-70 family RNA polymerase sigma factor n=1 Tax=Terriglobus sp. TAA 43 TaxID=278961 RepID=UPI00068DB682|nr:sigma-70 family RNA polymerase sigma factor [Terriglobus sp. TAA 43]